jgi:hypothetical protein
MDVCRLAYADPNELTIAIAATMMVALLPGARRSIHGVVVELRARRASSADIFCGSNNKITRFSRRASPEPHRKLAGGLFCAASSFLVAELSPLEGENRMA